MNMTWAWGDFWQRSRNWLRVGWLVTAGLVALYVGVIEPRQIAREIDASRTIGLGAVAGGSIMPWRQSTPSYHSAGYYSASQVMGGGGGGSAMKLRVAAMAMNAPPDADKEKEEDRKLVRTCTVYLIAKAPAEAATSIRQMAERMGGYLENSQINGSDSASITIRVPAIQIEAARAEIRKLGVRVESDRLEAQDVTKDYVDRAARLRNLHAQEEQYLAIMKRATTVKDTLEVSEQLNEVRGQIEQQQAEFNALSKQVETVAISVTLTAESDAQVFGLNWRPLFRLKIAARDGLNGLADYVAAMTAFVFYIPSFLLWLATLLIGAAIGWRVLRWAARILFMSRKTSNVEAEAQ